MPLARIEMRARASGEDAADQAGERAEAQAMLAQVKHVQRNFSDTNDPIFLCYPCGAGSRPGIIEAGGG